MSGRIRSKSEAKRGGVPDSHKSAQKRVVNFIKQKIPGVIVYEDWPQKFDDAFITFHKLDRSRDFLGHEYDIMVQEIFTGYAKFVIEIGDVGDDSRHNPDHPNVLINDGINRNWIETRLPLCKYIKMNKDDTQYSDWIAEKLGIPNQ